ncbi:globin [Paenibacillus sp. FJAT-26967]|uniref:globin domain-containing protein n=1 Tax=Paenibacillus sp. FJAT-26967 TaxID=1729690 RepID=UPI000839292B|nr:globin [Paenibacillus sp. FJAT-26967]
MTSGNELTLYALIGGEPHLRMLVEAFYPRVQEHPLLGPLFPEDIRPVMEKQIQFLTQFFGGPMLYTEEHGHPMMRARHMPFAITPERAEAWLFCMKQAAEEIGMPDDLKEIMLARLQGPAHHFVNQAST